MLDPDTEEKASLYVLGIMDPAERTAFEAAQEADPALKAMVRDLRTNVEALALAAPPMTAPLEAYARIQARIHGGYWSNRWTVLGWPLAACLALGWSLTAFYLSPPSMERESNRHLMDDKPHFTQGRTSPAEDKANDPQSMETALARQKTELNRLNDDLKTEQARNKSLRDQLDQLGANAAKLENRYRMFAHVQPGANRVLIVNMRDPKAKSNGSDVLEDASKILSDEANKRVNNALAPEKATGDKSATVTDALVGGNNTFSPPPTMTTADGTSNTKLNSANSNQTTNTSIPQLTGVAVFDQAAQTGSLVLSGMPTLADNQNFQLWAADAQYSVNIGTLPKLTNGAGQVTFKIDTLDFTPLRFFMTVEPVGGAMHPTGPVILDGPAP